MTREWPLKGTVSREQRSYNTRVIVTENSTAFPIQWRLARASARVRPIAPVSYEAILEMHRSFGSRPESIRGAMASTP
jgi:hypothetical protein